MKHLGFWALAFTAFLAACGDDTSSSPVDDPDSSSALSSSERSDGNLSSSSDKQGNSSSEKQNASSSNEAVQSSSSEAPKPPAEITYGTLTDERDGKTYKTVVIGKQTWMAENLNFETRFSYCYENKDENCAKYGRLYTWDAAMEACPSGWGLPSLEEFQALVAAVGGYPVAGEGAQVYRRLEGRRQRYGRIRLLRAPCRLHARRFDVPQCGGICAVLEHFGNHLDVSAGSGLRQ